MLERDRYRFFDTSSLAETRGIEKRAEESYIRTELAKRFPEEEFPFIHVEKNTSGTYRGKCSLLDRLWGSGKPIEGLPDYYEIEIHHKTGKHTEELIVWSPTAWNDRFAGTAGGGTGIGGRSYLTRPDDTTRGWTVPYAVMNGFTAATMYAGNVKGFHDLILDRKTGEFSWELYENWRVRSTHNMTRFGKAVAEILHGRPVKYSYMNGGSGGGRQSLMEVQDYPLDYDGVWAACPAINWNHFILAGFWPVAVMNERNHFLTAKKNQFFLEQVHEKNGGRENFYRLSEIQVLDAMECVGMMTPGGVITKEDAAVMNDIWRGPYALEGERLWYGYYPGVKNWQVGIPIGAYYYPFLRRRKIKPFILGTYHARWVTGNPKQDFGDMDRKQFEELFAAGAEKFGDTMGDNPAIEAFIGHGGKLLMDHGMDDPLIPTEGTLDYYRRLCAHFGAEKVQDFCRLYITPGDNHGNCWGNGPGIPESVGMQALMDWVERGIAPGALRKVRVEQKSGRLIEEGIQEPYKGSGTAHFCEACAGGSVCRISREDKEDG